MVTLLAQKWLTLPLLQSFKHQGGVQSVVNKTGFCDFWEEGRTSWPCCSRLKVLSVSLSLVLHQGSLHPFSRPALFPLLAESPTICTNLPNERTDIWCTELARGALSYQTRSLSAPGNRPCTHRFLNGLHYIDQTPWRHLAHSLLSVRGMCAFINIWLPLLVWVFHLSLLSGEWAESAQDLKAELANGGRLWEEFFCFTCMCVCWRPDKIRFVNRNQFHT